MAETSACTSFHKAAPAAKIAQETHGISKGARTGGAVDFVALMPRLNDGGEKTACWSGT
jgi:hypothetical protein